MAEDPDLRETPSLMTQAFAQLRALIQSELALARAEIGRSVATGGTGIALIGVGAILALVGLNVLASALVAWIAEQGLSIGMAALIVGGVLLVVAIILALVGKSRLSPEALTPKRTPRNLRRDIDTMKEASHVR